MSPKERVKANIYKQLLAEEKQKNKKISFLSIFLFGIGLLSSSIYSNFISEKASNIPVLAINKEISTEKSDANLVDYMYDSGVINDNDHSLELSTDDLFGVDYIF